MDNLAIRIQRLEDIESIRQLKARYFHACDRKDIAAIKSCFGNGKIHIDYGAIGIFDNRDAFLAVYQQMACHPHIIDVHHGQNAQIHWNSEFHATAIWDLFFYQIDKSTNNLTQLAGFYTDKFEKVDGNWVIVETIFRVSSSLVSNIGESNLKVLFAGAAPSQ